MKSVLFFRHGKSDWGARYDHDHERPLAKRGRKAAKKMGRYLAVQGPIPDRILCSTALRARETLERALKAGSWAGCTVQFSRMIYEAGPDELLARIRDETDGTQVLMIVGHEPVLSILIAESTGHPWRPFPTAAMAEVVFAVTRWEQVEPGKGRLAWLVRPRSI